MTAIEKDSHWTSNVVERMKTYKYWPYKKGSCSPDKMAEAGFYAIGDKAEPDLVMCYVCLKQLDGWEKDDDPWQEHKKHAPQCAYVNLNKKPAELTVKDVLTLDVERTKRQLVLSHANKIKTLEQLKESVIEELEKTTSKGGKVIRKGKTSRAPSKRSSRKE